jgi:integrase
LLITKGENTPIPVHALSFWIRRSNHFGIKPWTAHDLRRTCATRLAEMGTPPHIIQRILNHVQTGITGRVYDQHTYSEEITSVLESWSQKVANAIDGKV